MEAFKILSRDPSQPSDLKEDTSDQAFPETEASEKKQEFAYIGKRTPRRFDWKKVTGEAEYISDIYLPNMLYGKVLRSPVPHAKILKIDTSDAEKLDGVVAVITGEDTPQIKFAFAPPAADKLFLETEKVRYVGDEIAAVAAIDEKTAQKALDLIRVDFEELRPLYTPGEAMKPDAPRIHEGAAENISVRISREFGNVEAGFAEADYIFEDQFQTSQVTACCMETYCSVAAIDYNGTFRKDYPGSIIVWSCTQTPFPLVQQLAHVLNISPSRIKVIHAQFGGGFGTREGMDPIDPITVLLSLKTGRPVKTKLTRKEEFETSRTRHPMNITIKTGIKRDGTLTARAVKIITNNGAYNSHGVSVTRNAGSKASQLYRIPHYKYEGCVVYTNTIYGGALRGYGNPQVHFAIESQMDMIAERIGMDRVELRLKNTNQPGDITVSGARITSCALSECIRSCAKELGIDKPRIKKPFQGVGMAAMIHTGGGNKTYGYNFSSVKVKINYDGIVTVYTGSVDMGQGAHAVITQIVAETLGVPIDGLRLVATDTDSDVTCMGSHASRITFIAGNAAKIAAENAKKKVLQIAADILEESPETLDMRDGEIFAEAVPEKKVSIEDVTRNAYYDRRQKGVYANAGAPIIGWGFFDDKSSGMADPKTGYGNINPTYTFGAQGVELAVDPETGKVSIIRFVAVHDIGRVINLTTAEGQLYGGALQGIGEALFEEITVDPNGRVRESNFLDYKIQTAADMPEIDVTFVESVDPEGPYGAKAFGECPLVPTTAAIANALYDATGYRFTKIPIKAEYILNAITERGKKGE